MLSTRLAPETPAYDVQQACGTGLETTILVANKIALGQIDAGIACGADTTSDAPIALNEELRETLLEANRAALDGRQAARADRRPPRPHRARDPPQRGAAHRPLDGRALRDHGRPNGRSAAPSRTSSTVASHQNLAAAYERGFLDDLITPYLGLERDQNLRPDSSLEKLAKLKPVFGGPEGTMTAANSTPLSDGASRRAARLRGVGEGARPAGPRLHHRGADRRRRPRPQARRPADGARLRDAADARPRRARPQDFDYYEIHEAFAAQVLCTLKAWEDPEFCKEKLGRDKPLGSIDRAKLNVNGGSLAAGHPFAATGGRIVAGLAKQLHEDGKGRGVISICAAGGQGVVAILESAGGEAR